MEVTREEVDGVSIIFAILLPRVSAGLSASDAILDAIDCLVPEFGVMIVIYKIKHDYSTSQSEGEQPHLTEHGRQDQ